MEERKRKRMVTFSEYLPAYAKRGKGREAWGGVREAALWAPGC